MRNFRELLEARWAEGKFVCVGLDSDVEKLPYEACLGKGATASITGFNKSIVDATKDIVCAYKPNIAFYECHGALGWGALRETVHYILTVAPEVPIILDAKRADIGKTNVGYIKEAFNLLGADAITVNPYFGMEAMKPFLEMKEKGIIVLCRTSNPGAGEFQDMTVMVPSGTFGGVYRQTGCYVPLYQYVAHRVATEWNASGNCALVVGATAPKELAEVRKIASDIPILIPGIGTQGGDLEATVKAGADSRGSGMIINASSSIIFASHKADFAEAARRETERLHNLINQYRKGGNA